MSCRNISECGKDSLLQAAYETHTKRDSTPRINGSLGAFIAVVVCLTLFLMACCTAIVFLLRDQRAFDEETARQRKQSDFEHASQLPPYHFRDGAPIQRPWNILLLDIFRRNNAHNVRQRDIGRGQSSDGVHPWMETGSADGLTEVGASPGRPSKREFATPSPLSLYPTRLSGPPVIPVSRTTSGSTSIARFDMHFIHGLEYPDRHPSPHPTLPNIHSQLSSPRPYSPISSPPPARTLSPETIPEEMPLYNDNGSRQYVTPSGIIMRTLPGGSKFIEAL